MSDDFLSGNISGNRKCTKCCWTVFTGGMTPQQHERLGHGPLVDVNLAQERQKEQSNPHCKHCGLHRDDNNKNNQTSCKFHSGNKDHWTRSMIVGGAHVTFTWSCCGAKYDYKDLTATKSETINVHADGCQTSSHHEY